MTIREEFGDYLNMPEVLRGYRQCMSLAEPVFDTESYYREQIKRYIANDHTSIMLGWYIGWVERARTYGEGACYSTSAN